MRVGEIEFLLTLNSGSFDSQLNSLESRTSGFRGVLDGAFAVAIGSALIDSIQALVGVIGGAVSKGMEFSSVMSETAALADIPVDSSVYTQLRDQILQLGADSKFTSAQVGEGASVMAAAGLNQQQIMQGLPGLVSLASVENMGFAQSSDIAVSAMNGFRMGADQLARVADVMTKASADSNVSVASLGQSMKYISPVAGQLKLNFEDVNATLGILGNVGIKGAQAGRNLASGLMFLSAPSIKAKALMDSLNISVVDASGNFKQLPDLVGSLNTAFAGMSDTQKEAAMVTLVGKDNLKTWLPLVDAGKSKIDAFSESLEHSQGKAADIAAKKMDNLKGSIEFFKGALETVTTRAFIDFEGGLKLMADDATKAVGIIGPSVDTFAKKLAVSFNQTYLSLRIFGLEFYNASNKVAFFKSKIVDFFTYLKSSESPIYKITSALSSMLQPLGIIGTALKVVVDTLGYFVTQNGEYLDNLSNDFSNLKDYAISAFNTIVSYVQSNLPLWLSTLASWGSGLWQWILDAIPTVLTTLQTFAQNVFTWVIANYPTWLQNLQVWGTALWQWISNAVPLALTTLLEWRNQLVNWVLTSLPSWIDSLATWAMALGRWITDAAPKALASFTFYTVQLIGYIGAALPGIIDKLNYWSLELLNWITGSTPGATSELGTYVGQILDAIGKALPGIVTSLGTWVAALAEWVIDVWPKLEIGLLGLITTVGIWIGDRIPIIATYLAGWIDSFATWVEKVWPKLETNVGTVINALLKWIGDNGPPLLTKLGEWAMKFVEFIGPYIPKVLVGLGTLLSDILTWIIQRAPDFVEKLKEWGTALGKWVTDTAIPYLQLELPKLWQAFSDWFVQKAKDIQADGSIGQAIVNGIKYGASATWQSFKDYLYGQLQTIPRDLNTIGNSLRDGGIFLINAFKEGITIQIGAVLNLATDIGMRFKDKINEWQGALKDAGTSLIQNFWQGIQDRFNQLRNDFAGLMQSLRNMLPGSEPKDSSSPLRNLGDAGMALIGNFQDGINAADLTITPKLQSLSDAMQASLGNPTMSVTPEMNGLGSLALPGQSFATTLPSMTLPSIGMNSSDMSNGAGNGTTSNNATYSITIDARGSNNPKDIEDAGYRGAQRALKEVGVKTDIRLRTQ